MDIFFTQYRTNPKLESNFALSKWLLMQVSFAFKNEQEMCAIPAQTST